MAFLPAGYAIAGPVASVIGMVKLISAMLFASWVLLFAKNALPRRFTLLPKFWADVAAWLVSSLADCIFDPLLLPLA